MTTFLAFIVTIGVLVIFHELGHYWVARWCDVKVLRFSVGFGKVIYSTHFGKGETEWTLSAIPLGGYVKMLDEREGEVAEAELPRAFNRKPVWQRMAIVAAGPVANLLLAVVLYWALLLHGVPGVKPVLGEVAPNTPAAAAHFEAKEQILSIEGTPIPSWQDLHWTLLTEALQHGTLMVEARTEAGELRHHELDMRDIKPSDLEGDFLPKLGLQLWSPPVAPVIDKVLDGSVAQRAGLLSGDVIEAINGAAVSRWEQVVEVVRNHPGEALQLQIRRGSETLSISVTPDSVTDANKQVGRIGAAPRLDQKAFESMLTEVSYPPSEALHEGLRRTWQTSVLSLQMMAKMVTGEVSVKNLSGPITIADYAGQSAQAGLAAYIAFLALISISLGVLNLLPIPLLDGGHLLYYTVEFFKGSPVSDQAWELGQKIGVMLLALLMSFALYNDISRLIQGHL